MKTMLIILLVILVATASLVVGYFIFPGTGVCADEIERIGYEAGQAYREQIDELLAQFDNRLTAGGIGELERSLHKLEAALEKQGKLTASHAAGLEQTRDGLVELQLKYEIKLEAAIAQRDDLRTTKAGVTGQALSGFVAAYTIINSHIAGIESSIESLEHQVVSLTKLIDTAGAYD
jgi:Skp family chaperone for outer membrane proteins